MSRVQEIEAYRNKLAEAIDKKNEDQPQESLFYTEPPEDFFTYKQSNQYFTHNQVITETTHLFMKEFNFEDYELSREFRVTRFGFATSKDLHFLIKFGHMEEDFYNNPTRITYEPVGRFFPGNLALHRGLPVLVPEKNKKNASFEASELVDWINSPEATHLVYPSIFVTGEIREHKVRDLLTLIIANPRLKFPFSQITK